MKKSKKKIRRKNRLNKIIFLIFIIIGMTIFAMITPIFNIKQINVVGNDKLEKETIISLSGLVIEENIFKNLKYKVENNIKENSYIKDVSMKRILPGTVELNIKERKVAYQVELIDGYIYIDNQGYILENNSNKENVPILQGITTSEQDLINGNRLNIQDLNKLNTVIKIMDALKSAKIDGLVTNINIQDVNEYILHFKSEHKYIYLGDASNLNNKILYIQMMLEEEDGKSGVMFINGDLNKGFKPYFREDIKENKEEKNNQEKKKGDKNE